MTRRPRRPRPAFTARRPVDLLALAPYVLGFRPADSVVLLTFDRSAGAGETFHARVDLPVDEDHQVAVAAMLADVVRRHRVPQVAVLVYSDDAWAAATFNDAVRPAMRGAGAKVVDVLRVGPDRFHDAADVHDPGTAYDLTTHPFTAAQVYEGKVALSSRDDLVARIAATVDGVAEVEAALRQLELSDEGVDAVTEARWVQQVVRAHLGGTPLSPPDAARLLGIVSVVGIRDVAWAEMSRDTAEQHVELWSDLVRRCPEDLVPAPASLLAFAAWLAGHGALSWCALDRCAAVDPAYSMAECIAGLLERAVPPSVWVPMGEDELPVFGGSPGLAAS